MKKNKDLYKEGYQYITCYVTPDGKFCPMGEAKRLSYAKKIANKHKHVLCHLTILDDRRENNKIDKPCFCYNDIYNSQCQIHSSQHELNNNE